MRLTTICTLLLTVALPVHAAENWPEFLGPHGNNHALTETAPLRWSETENITWRTPIHDRGHSTPVVLGDQIWLTTAREDGTRSYAVCLDFDSGRVLHDRLVFETPAEDVEEKHALNSFASPSAVIEPGRVWVHFGEYGTACLDTTTAETIWERRDLRCSHFRGPGSSPIIVEDMLILTYDGIDVQYLVALDKRTGRTIWRTDRTTDFDGIDPDFRKAYSTPTVITVDGQTQLVSTGAQATIAYDPHTGRELWKVRHPGFSNTPRPQWVDGLLYLNSGFGRTSVLAVRPGGTGGPGGTGDLTDSHVAWTYSRGVPKKPTPIIVDGLLYMISDDGVITCLDAATGERVWHGRLPGQYSATPLYAAGRIYLANHEGLTTVIAPGRELEILAENRLPTGCMASPVALRDTMLLRTARAVYKIEQPKD